MKIRIGAGAQHLVHNSEGGLVTGYIQWRNGLGVRQSPMETSTSLPDCSPTGHSQPHRCPGAPTPAPGQDSAVCISFWLGFRQTHRLLAFSFLSSANEVAFCCFLFHFQSFVNIFLLLLLLLFSLIPVGLCPFFVHLQSLH